jgi:hypothetical protein
MICGTKCQNTPKFQITPELYQYTLTRLSQFYVIFLENMYESYNVFAQEYGWDQILTESELHQNAKFDNRTKFTKSPQEKAWDPLMNVLDDALYDFARQQYHDKLKQFDTIPGRSNSPTKPSFFGPPPPQPSLIKDYFMDGPKRSCPNPCCGECSFW